MNTTYTEAVIFPTFCDWWNLYDHKLDKKRCERMWSKMSQVDKEMAMQHTERYVQSTFTDGAFPSRRHPGTYLHNENWNDEALIRKSTPVSGGSALDQKKREVLQSIVDRSRGAGSGSESSDEF